MVLFSSIISLLTFYLLYLSITDRGVMYPTIIMDLLITPCSLISVCFMYFIALLLGTYILFCLRELAPLQLCKVPLYIFFKFIFIVESITDVPIFPIDPLHPTPTLPTSFIFILEAQCMKFVHSRGPSDQYAPSHSLGALRGCPA
uniref:Uncharacterized protein n=1 Tax=Myotis myotis TaxID=51298 RepID=A0A7J7YFF2_MYOMY|nr:hypothetical protein mMyoMyo1_011176 [Myotis myotis]